MDKNHNNLNQNFRQNQISSLFHNTSLANDSKLSKINNSKRIYLDKKFINKDYLNNAQINSKNNIKDISKKNNHINSNYNIYTFDNEENLKPPKIVKIPKKRRGPSVDMRRNIKDFKELLSNNNDNNNFDMFLPTKAIHRESIPGIIGLKM